jgi:UDP-N-acetylglucosamine:LPS N-acetylglucosamine transferase
MILDRDLISNGKKGGEKLAAHILALFATPQKLTNMGEAAKQLGHPHAADEIVSACLELAKTA